MTPAKTPVRLPRTDAGLIPARSNASQEVSRSRRCCGSIASASRGEIPNNPASNSAASYRKPPVRAYPPTPLASSCQPRSSGNPPTPSRPEATSSHSSPGERTPPG